MDLLTLRIAMAVKDIDNVELARRVGVSQVSVWRWAHGKSPMTPENAIKVVRALYEQPAGGPDDPDKAA